MTLEETLNARLDFLLERQPGTDEQLAVAALEECAAAFGEPALREALLGGSLPAFALIELSRGVSREAVALKFAAHIGGSTAH